MDVVVRTGGCLCGAVRYSVRGEPVHVGRCHCADCRKESGSAFTVYAQWPVEAFELSGDISSFDGRGFCPRCGSPVLNPPEPGDTQIETTYRAVRAGFRVVELPITFADREVGGSKMSRSIVLEAIWKVPQLRLAALRGRL